MAESSALHRAHMVVIMAITIMMDGYDYNRLCAG
jgi:hypothetical protein